MRDISHAKAYPSLTTMEDRSQNNSIPTYYRIACLPRSDSLSSSRSAIELLCTTAQTTGFRILAMLATVLTLIFGLLPSVFDAPSTKALVARVIACKMTILLEAPFRVSTRDMIDQVVGTHAERVFSGALLKLQFD